MTNLRVDTDPMPSRGLRRIFPALTQGKPVAKLTLLKGTTFKTVIEKLD